MTVFTKSYDAPPVDKSEILRYVGVRHGTQDVEALMECCLKEIPKLSYRVCYCEIPSSDLPITDSLTLKKAIHQCYRIIVFAATVGIEMDRLIAKYSSISPATALMMQAIGTERIESLCNTFCRDVAANRMITSRVSPGYGDIPMEMQRDIFVLLDCSKRIGITLSESLLMSPTKSVTAIFGVKNGNT